MKFVDLCCAVLFASAANAGTKPVTIEGLLAEMTDPDAVTYSAAVPYQAKLTGSTDRRSFPPKNDWYANEDRNGYLRVETNAAGRAEWVMADVEGPGVMTRFWTAGRIGGDFRSGDRLRLRIYIDDAPEPVVEGPAFSIIGDRLLCGSPLSAVLSRGYNLFLPLPFSRRFKVTVSNWHDSEDLTGPDHGHWWNIETRRYPDGTPVEGCTRAVLDRARGAIAAANAKLAAGPVIPSNGVERLTFDGRLAPGETKAVELSGTGAVRYLSLLSREDTGDYPFEDATGHALDAVELSLAFDGVETVRAPLGDFFGTGTYQVKPFETRYLRAAADGFLESFWVMPFEKSCRLVLRNVSDVPVALSRTSLVRGPYAYDPARSLRFRTECVHRPGMRTRLAGRHHDVRMADVRGGGKLVGTALTVVNPVASWWGEGDEKIFVDDERFPSFFGTGSEDFFCYAWSSPDRFTHPFAAQPTGEGNLHAGTTVNFRGRVLDAIPFTKHLAFDMECWAWCSTRLTYDSICYLYVHPGL